MTQDQVMATLRQLLPVLGTLALSFGVSAGTWNHWSNTIMTLAGPVMIIGSFVWSMVANSKTSIIASAAAMPEVKAITVNDQTLANAAKDASPTTTVTVKP